ncbi:MAG TPA: DUF2723 domain-containing protein [Phycisphaerae bacterium]|nr:DUF2723 domain-containing protein [Phycisphaerae bacterium]HNU46323.1 DUF2723 domain-containing protein [Phycisphaerae bacterium]
MPATDTQNEPLALEPLAIGAVAPGQAWWTALLAAAALYAATLAPGVLWGDSGEAQLHVYLGGWYVNGEIVRSHVVYYAVARGLGWLWALPAALAGNVTSAVMGALTVANVAWLAARLLRERVSVVAATGMLALAHTHWQLSTSAEVVTTSSALLTAELIFLVRAVQTHRVRFVVLTMLANGLGVSNHNFALLMWPVYALVALRWQRTFARRRTQALLGAGGGLLLGMAPVLVLGVHDWLARGSLAGTLESFLVGHYGRHVANLERLPALAARAGLAALLNFPTPLWLLVVPGSIRLYRRSAGPVWWVLGGATAVHLAFVCRYDVPDQHTFLAPVCTLLALFLAAGVDACVAWRGARAVRVLLLLLAVPAPAVYAALPTLLRKHAAELTIIPTRPVPYRDPWTWFVRPWRRGYDGADRFARETLAALPQGALLVVDATLCPPLNYVQAVDGLRRDVRLDCWIARQAWLEAVETDEAWTTLRGTKCAAGLLFTTAIPPQNTPQWLRDWHAGGRVRCEPVGHVYRVVPTAGF